MSKQLSDAKSLHLNRIESIDLLRGVVMIIMTLDHVRDYFHADAYLYNPLDLDKTNFVLFFTRWVTHFCAPVFVFLAGTSAYFVGSRKGTKDLSMFLLKRGLWLIVLEFTVINFSWFFNIHFSLLTLTVIWALAMSMIVLAGAIHLPFKIILSIGLLLVAGHNLFDDFHVTGDTPQSALWAVMHEFRGFELSRFYVFVGYPLLPWIGIMLIGYCFGKLYSPDTQQQLRQKTLYYLGFSAIIMFILIRALNLYGDLHPWVIQRDTLYTFLSFINVTKYPPSFLYVLITLGPALIFLAVSENYRGEVTQKIVGLGRVPMFYYIIHLYIIHIVAMFAALATGFNLSDMVFTTWITDSPNLKGYGFGLGVVYIVWLAIVIGLFPFCLWYDRYKRNHKDQWWLSYL